MSEDAKAEPQTMGLMSTGEPLAIDEADGVRMAKCWSQK